MPRRAAADAGEAAHTAGVVPNARAAAVFLHVSDLRPNPRNPRVHGPEVLKLARTILRTAWDRLARWRRDGAHVVRAPRGGRGQPPWAMRAEDYARRIGVDVEMLDG